VSMTRNVRKYDAEFKRNAVSLYISSGKSYPVLGKELGVWWRKRQICL